MSYDFNVYVRRDRLPVVSDLRSLLERAGAHLELEGLDDLTTVSGFLPVVVEGVRTGFELYCDEITEKQRSEYRDLLEQRGKQQDEFLDILTACDLDIGLSAKAGDAREVAAARIVARTLAEA